MNNIKRFSLKSVLFLCTILFSTMFGAEYDFGDANDPSYPTLESSNGAYHIIVPGFCLGSIVDAEINGLPESAALGDDNDGSDDEDGIIFITPLIPGQQAVIEVTATSTGFLDAWVDFDKDGNWTQISDRIFLSQSLSAGKNVMNFEVPDLAAVDIDTYARFRFSSVGELAPEGPAANGEVEDYHILIGKNGPYVPEEVNVPHIKWTQSPIEIEPNLDAPTELFAYGEAARSTHQSGSKRQWRMDADDFHSLGSIPVTCIRWWGTYKAWKHSVLPETKPQAWHICFWANMVEDLEPNELYPERIVWALEIPPERIKYKPVGLTQFPDKSSDMCYVYELALDPNKWFYQGDFESNADIFWISITAVYPTDIEQVNMWNWITRPHIWGNGAVTPAIMGDWPTYDERLFPGRIYPVENPSLCGQNQPYDMCFELLTEQSWIKCDQPFTGIRDLQGYIDNISIGIEPNEGEISVLQQAADDWICESNEPVIAIGWNGFYEGYAYDPYECNDINEPLKPDFFLLSIWNNEEPDGVIDFNHPGDIIWEYKAYDYDEVLVGYNKYLSDEPDEISLYHEPNEPVFRYSVRLPSQDWFIQKDVNNIYWISITAAYKESTVDIPYSWGWLEHSNDDNNPALRIDYTSASEPKWETLTDIEGHLFDMSFTLYTGEEPNIPEL